MAASWSHCRVGGVPVQAEGYEVDAPFGTVVASECVLQGAQHEAEAVAGTSCCFKLTIADAEQTGRRFDASEDVTAFISGQSFQLVVHH